MCASSARVILSSENCLLVCFESFVKRGLENHTTSSLIALHTFHLPSSYPSILSVIRRQDRICTWDANLFSLCSILGEGGGRAVSKIVEAHVQEGFFCFAGSVQLIDVDCSCAGLIPFSKGDS